MNEMKFTKDHEWILQKASFAFVGITNHAQENLGDIVFIELSQIGKFVNSGDQIGIVESVKAASDLISPASGEIIEVNNNLQKTPQIICKTQLISYNYLTMTFSNSCRIFRTRTIIVGATATTISSSPTASTAATASATASVGLWDPRIIGIGTLSIVVRYGDGPIRQGSLSRRRLVTLIFGRRGRGDGFRGGLGDRLARSLLGLFGGGPVVLVSHLAFPGRCEICAE